MAQQPIQLLVVVIDLAGGTGTFCRALGKGLKQFCASEFDVSLLLLRDRGLDPSDREIFSRIHVIGSDVHADWRRLYETPMHAMQVRRTIRAIPSDLIFTISTYANLLVPAMARKRKVVLSVHTNTSEQLRGARFAGVIGRLMRWGYPGRPIVVPARGVADDLRQNFGASDVKVIHHGIDAPAIQALAEQPITDLPTTRPYIVACGRLAAQKDYPTLLHAYASARSRGADEDLVIIGDGPDRAMLEHLTASLGLKQTVHFIGHRSNPFPYMKPARFFVLCSIWEGFGLVLLEAMSLGLPCISTDCPSGPAEILENGQRGLLVPTRDPASLAEALLNLSESQDLRESFAHQSRQRAQELGLGRMAQAYRDLFVGELNRDR